MPGSLRLGRIAGIDVFVHISWIIILVFLTVSLASGWFPRLAPGYTAFTYFLLGLLSTMLFLLCIFLHELAHSLVARARGLRVKRIVLFIFGGVSDIEQEPRSASDEFLIAIVGPLMSLLLGGIAFALFALLRDSRSLLPAALVYLAFTNILLGIFNLLPGFPLDGGRVFRSIVWKITGDVHRATRIATFVGQAIAYLLILLGIWMFFGGDPFDGLWFGFIGWFLLSSAHAVRSQDTIETVFAGVTVGQMMSQDPVTVPANISLQRLVDEYFLPKGLRSAFVVQGEQLAGLITLGDIRTVAREQWPQTPVGFSMIPIERLHTVAPQQSLREALTLMSGQNVNQLPVVLDGKLVGVLSRETILRALHVRRALRQAQSKAA